MYRGVLIIQAIIDDKTVDETKKNHRLTRIKRALVIDTIGNNLKSGQTIIAGCRITQPIQRHLRIVH